MYGDVLRCPVCRQYCTEDDSTIWTERDNELRMTHTACFARQHAAELEAGQLTTRYVDQAEGSARFDQIADEYDLKDMMMIGRAGELLRGDAEVTPEVVEHFARDFLG